MTALKAVLSASLESELYRYGNSYPQIFIDLFLDWKNSDEDSNYFFGRDGRNRDSEFLRHVHLVPIASPEALAQWDKNWSSYRARKSDRYLFYVDGGAFGYLLLHVVNDPGAHDFLSNPMPADKLILQVMEKVADDFYHFGVVPK